MLLFNSGRQQVILESNQTMATTTATPTFADAGTLFNEATHLLEGGLWQNVVSEGGQGLGSAGKVTTDLQTVQADLQAGVAAGQYTGQALTDVQAIIANLGQEVTAATASVSGGGTFGSVAAAETALHNLHLGIISTVANDATLATAATANGATGFQAAPAAFANGTTAANAPHATFADIGAIFNDAANMLVGGANSSNMAAIKSDIDTARTDLQHLIAANPTEFGGLTGIHAQTIVNQLKLEDTFLSQVGTNPDAARALNDNMNDINDIVAGDTNLANMANQNGVQGFTPLPATVTATPHYQDTADQTNFWANFIAQSNTLGGAAEAAVGSGNQAAISGLITQLKAFETNSANFDMSQGGIFEARFDNELAGGKSTLGAEISAMIKGLNTGNAALVTAAAQEMHANAADVGGNNVPVNGGTYNAAGLTVADVLSTAGTVAGATVAAGTANAVAANGATAATVAAGQAMTAGTATAGMTATAGTTATTAATGTGTAATTGTSTATAPADTAANAAGQTAAGTPAASTATSSTGTQTAAANANGSGTSAAAGANGSNAAGANHALDALHNAAASPFQQQHHIDHFGHMWG